MPDKKGTKPLPKAPSLRSMIGPSIILLGLGLGSGELILWPYLISQYGLGIIWAAVLGIAMQFFINMEIERYTLIKGESIFVGFARRFPSAPYWFIFSTFIAWFWPGIIASSAKIFSLLLGFRDYRVLGIIGLITIGTFLTLGKSLYKTVESFQKTLILLGLPLILILAIIIAGQADYRALAEGLIGIGNGYYLLPKDIDIYILLGALAYSGAGGNLNLAQSFYIKEKGYGMCRDTVGISSVLYKNLKKIHLEGKTFDINPDNITKFNNWWKKTNLEHLLVFLLTGTVTVLLVALLSYSTTFGKTGLESGINFIATQAQAINRVGSNILGGLFLFFVSMMLFGTQLTVLDSTSRIIAENIVIIERKTNLRQTYYTVVWLQIITGVTVLLVNDTNPLGLVLISAVINAGAMLVHIILTYILNQKELDNQLKPTTWRKVIIFASAAVFAVLMGYSIFDALSKIS